MAKSKSRKRKEKKLKKKIREYILMRDDNLCQRCKKFVTGQNAHISHVIPKSHGNVLRYDEMNLKLLCFKCHIGWWHKNPVEAGEWFKGYAPQRWEYLQKMKEFTKKITEDDLDELYEEYERKHQDLITQHTGGE